MPTFNLMNPGHKISMVNLDGCNYNIANILLGFFLKINIICELHPPVTTLMLDECPV